MWLVTSDNGGLGQVGSEDPGVSFVAQCLLCCRLRREAGGVVLR